MARSKKICSICGKTYEPCHTMMPKPGIFRWQLVACSPECGMEYLRRLRIARGQMPEPDIEKPEPEAVAEAEPQSAEEEIPETPKVAQKRTRKKKEDSEE